MTSRRRFIQIGALGALAPAVFAQTRPVKVGMLASRPLEESIFTAHIIRRLEQLGYRRDAGMLLEYRYPRASEGFRALARELGALKCDIVLNAGTVSAAAALLDAQIRAPVVFLAVNYDPIRAGVVKSLRRPGGNATGVYLQQEAIAAKRLDLMREVLPKTRRLAVLTDRNTKEQLVATKNAAAAAGIELEVGEFDQRPYDFAPLFDRANASRVDAVTVLGSPIFAESYRELGTLLAKAKLPGIGSTGTADAGFLVSYNADPIKAAHRTAAMADRILKGANPADMPVELADEFEMVVNLRTAKALNLKIPYSVLARATRIVE